MTQENRDKSVQRFFVIQNNKESDPALFSDCSYVVPLYQREYAWHPETEIQRLLDDIKGINRGDSVYYRLGLMSVVKTKDVAYEVIDGQQRLTTLYLLLVALRNVLKTDHQELHNLDLSYISNPLEYDGREKSQYTLEYIEKNKLIDKNTKTKADEIDEGIYDAFVYLHEWLKKLSHNDFIQFCENLKRTCIYRVPIPEKTDLNNYFIRVNNRGKQIALVDILKATLMAPLCKDHDAMIKFKLIWTACSNMNNFIQKSLKKKDWERLFEVERRDKCPMKIRWAKPELAQKATTQEFQTGNSDGEQANQPENPENLLNITEDYFKKSKSDISPKRDEDDDVNADSFESFIDFSTFLMHALKLCALENQNGNINQEAPKEIMQWGTDDKKLLEFFRINWEKATGSNTYDEVSVKHFLYVLLVSRFLYDGWVLKRSNAPDDSEGKWIINHLVQPESKSLYPVVSFNKEIQEKILKIQECLRVTYTSLNSMPWVTELLHLLYIYRNNPNDQGKKVLNLLEGIAIEGVCEEYKNKDQGTGTPRILFNYLDYVLWSGGLVTQDSKEEDKQKNAKNKRDTFEFAFWGSVEHWYPQHPEGENDTWKQLDLDSFGNLFLINGSDNSSLNNKLPEVKRNDILFIKNWLTNDSKKLSLKAVDMILHTKPNQGWTKQVCEELEKNHLEKLCESIKHWLDEVESEDLIQSKRREKIRQLAKENRVILTEEITSKQTAGG